MATETDDAFRELSDAELAALGPLGVRRAVSAGEYLYREGDPSYDFYVVLSGAVEIVVKATINAVDRKVDEMTLSWGNEKVVSEGSKNIGTATQKFTLEVAP